MMASNRKTRIEIVTPAQLIFTAFCIILVVLYVSSCLSGMYEHLSLNAHEINPEELNAELKEIERRLVSKEDELQVLILPEGNYSLIQFMALHGSISLYLGMIKLLSANMLLQN